MAVTSGARGAEAVVVMGASVADEDLAIVRDFAGAGVPVHLASAAGRVTGTRSS
jgi:hypothetical protein